MMKSSRALRPDSVSAVQSVFTTRQSRLAAHSNAPCRRRQTAKTRHIRPALKPQAQRLAVKTRHADSADVSQAHCGQDIRHEHCEHHTPMSQIEASPPFISPTANGCRFSAMPTWPGQTPHVHLQPGNLKCHKLSLYCVGRNTVFCGEKL